MSQHTRTHSHDNGNQPPEGTHEHERASERQHQASAITTGVYATAAATLFVVIGFCIAATWQGGARVAVALVGCIVAAGLCGYLIRAAEPPGRFRDGAHPHDAMEPALRHRATYNARGRINRN